MTYAGFCPQSAIVSPYDWQSYEYTIDKDEFPKRAFSCSGFSAEDCRSWTVESFINPEPLVHQDTKTGKIG
jgi:hypothetical protein